MCTAARAARIKGNRKCREKNRFRVGSPTANPPQTSWVRSTPMPGTALSMDVITVAPQRLICPNTRQYPRKAVRIITIRMTTPTVQTMAVGLE